MIEDLLYGHGWRFAVVVVLAAVNVIALGGQLLISRLVSAHHRQANKELLGHAAGIAGVINAVLFAFIVFAAWTDYDRARDVVDQESSLVVDIWRDIHVSVPINRIRGSNEELRFRQPLLPREVHDELLDDLRQYIEQVRGHEWPAMKAGATKDRESYHAEFEAGWNILGAAYSNVMTLEPVSVSQKTLIEDLVKRLNLLFEARRQRIAYGSHGSLTPVVWIVAVAGGLVSIACCWLLGFTDRGIHAMSTSLIATSIGLVIFLIVAINSPFRGQDQLPDRRFQIALKLIGDGEAEAHPASDTRPKE